MRFRGGLFFLGGEEDAPAFLFIGEGFDGGPLLRSIIPSPSSCTSSTHMAGGVESIVVATEHRMLAASRGSMESLPPVLGSLSRATQQEHIMAE